MFAFRVVPRLEAIPRVVAAVQTLVGRLLLVALFTGLLKAANVPAWWQTGVFLALTSLLPAYRKQLLVVAAVCWVWWLPPLQMDLLTELAQRHGAERWVKAWPMVVLGLWLAAGLYGLWIRRRPTSLLARRPILLMLVLLGTLLVASRGPLRGVAWFCIVAAAMVLSQYLWFFGYWLVERSSRDATSFPVQAGYWRPFWGFTHVPFGKGAAYMERVEARNDEQLAIVQLKGLKLMLWAIALSVVKVALNRLIGESQGHVWGGVLDWVPVGVIPSYPQAMEYHMQGHPCPLPMRWLVLIMEFTTQLLGLTVLGHKIVAACRMAGFNIFRNTYRPLEATSIADFYNRFYYYFKELLVTFFFYPTYLRYFRHHPRLRMFTATLAAAGLGNFLYHLLRDNYIMELGLWQALVVYHTYAVYALILGVAIGLSQLRALQKPRPPLRGLARVRATGGVLLFFCLVMTLGEPVRGRTIFHCGSYFLSLFWP